MESDTLSKQSWNWNVNYKIMKKLSQVILFIFHYNNKISYNNIKITNETNLLECFNE